MQQLEDLGLTVYYLSNPTTLEEMYTNLETVAGLTGHDVTELVASLKACVAAVDEKIAPLSSRIPVFYEIDATDPTKPWTYGPGTFGSLLIARAGGYNVGDIASDPYPQISIEQVVAANPSVIILGDSMWGVTPESVITRPSWETLPAVASNSIYPFVDNLVPGYHDALIAQGGSGPRGRLMFAFQPEDASPPRAYFSTRGIPLSGWVHVAVTFDDSVWCGSGWTARWTRSTRPGPGSARAGPGS